MFQRMSYWILVCSLLFCLEHCDSKYKYLTKKDKLILELITQKDVANLLPLFSRKVEFDYGSETSIIFLKETDSEELSKKNDSEVYRFLFELEENLKKESGWLSINEAIQNSYRIEGENNESLDDKSYLRSIHIYNEKSYNRINLRCVSENTCIIIYFTMASSRF